MTALPSKFDPIAIEAQMMGGDLIWGPYETTKEEQVPDTPKWAIFENAKFGWIEPAAMPRFDQGHNITQPPRLESIEEVEAFIADLREAADRVFGVDGV